MHLIEVHLLKTHENGMVSALWRFSFSAHKPHIVGSISACVSWVYWLAFCFSMTNMLVKLWICNAFYRNIFWTHNSRSCSALHVRIQADTFIVLIYLLLILVEIVVIIIYLFIYHFLCSQLFIYQTACIEKGALGLGCANVHSVWKM